MLKVIKKLLEGNPYTIAIGITVCIAYLSLAHLNTGEIFPAFSNVDKLEHSFAYFVLTCSWFFAVQKTNKSSKLNFLVILFVFLFGIFMEGMQMYFTSYRQGDLYDVLANSSGILFARLFFVKILDKITVFYHDRLA